MKLGDGMKNALVLGLSLFATARGTAVEEISKQISRTTSSCDVWEVCCASDNGLIQACQDIGLRAERYTIQNSYDLRKRSTSVSLTLKAKEEKPKKVWASPRARTSPRFSTSCRTRLSGRTCHDDAKNERFCARSS